MNSANNNDKAPSPDSHRNGESQEFDAFISHASADFERAKEITRSLEDSGLRCWIAPRNIQAGEEWPEAIMRGIRTSKCLVLVLSDNANASPMVSKEVERASGLGLPVFPIRLEEVLPSRKLELFVSSVHWVDAWSGDLSGHALKLADAMANERVVIELKAELKARLRKQRLPRQIAMVAGFVLILASIAAVNYFTSGGNGGSGRASNNEQLQQLQDAAEQADIDLDDIDRHSFDVSFTMLEVGRALLTMDVTTDPKLMALLRNPYLCGLEYRMGSKPFQAMYNSITTEGVSCSLSQSDIDTGGPLELRINPDFGHSDGKGDVYGPFDLRVDVRAKLHQMLVDKVNAAAWFTNERGYWKFAREDAETIIGHIKSIEFGVSEDTFNLLTLDVAKARSEAKPAFKNAPSLLFPRDKLLSLRNRNTLFARVHFTDHSESVTVPFRAAPSKRADAGRYGEITAKAGNRPGQIMFRNLDQRYAEITSITLKDTGSDDQITVELIPTTSNRKRPFGSQAVKDRGSSLYVPPSWDRVLVDVRFKNDESIEFTTSAKTQVPFHLDLKPLDPKNTPLARLLFQLNKYGGCEAVPLQLPAGCDRIARSYSVAGSNHREWTTYETVRINGPHGLDLPAEATLDSRARYLFQLESGEEVGPIEFSMAPVRDLLQRQSVAQVKKQHRELLTAEYFATNRSDRGYVIQPSMKPLPVFPIVIAKLVVNHRQPASLTAVQAIEFEDEDGLIVGKIDPKATDEGRLFPRTHKEPNQRGWKEFFKSSAILKPTLKKLRSRFVFRDGSSTNWFVIRVKGLPK